MGDFLIRPESKVAKLDTSQWPLLLKVSSGFLTSLFLCGLTLHACDDHSQFEHGRFGPSAAASVHSGCWGSAGMVRLHIWASRCRGMGPGAKRMSVAQSDRMLPKPPVLLLVGLMLTL